METVLHERILSAPARKQIHSPLFRLLPAEVRSHIFSYTLTDYPDPSPASHYDSSTCYLRPTYFAPRKSDTELLRTCRRVYRESWFLPFILKEQTHWLSAPDRAPPEYNVWRGLSVVRTTVQKIARQQRKDYVEIERLRVFAQMWRLERGELSQVMRIPHMRPRRFTLTIRHSDWWHWESDEPLRFERSWLHQFSAVLPSTVLEIRIELESIERKKDQIDKIATQMTKRWFFIRQDGVVLYADATPKSWEIYRWSGDSSWHDKRWVRDETEPGRIDYYMATVSFRPGLVIERTGGTISNEARNYARKREYDEGKLKLELPGQARIDDPKPYIDLKEASRE